MNTTFRRLTPGATYKAFLATRARPWVDMLQPCPGTPLASGAASATGDLTLDLPSRIEVLLQGPDNRGVAVLNSTTRGGTP